MALASPTFDAATVAMNDFRRRWRDVEVDVVAAVRQVGGSGWYVLGPELEAFERALAGVAETPFVVGCASGLDAIEIGLRALGLRAGEPVLTTPLSAFATTLAIVRAGGVPVFSDVDASGLLDLDQVEALLSARRDLRFLVPVHLYGLPLDLERLAALRDRFDLRVVEDCAQAIGARHGGRAVGSAGQLGAVSFYPTKNLGALGDAGAVLVGDPALRDACRRLRDYGQAAKYQHQVLGLNSRLDELQAAVMHQAFLPRLAGWTERRRHLAERYRRGIGSRLVQVLPVDAAAEPVWHLFPIRVVGGGRDELAGHLRSQGVESAVHYPILACDQAALAGTPFEVVGDLGMARALAGSELSLPIHPYLDDAEVTRVVAAVNAWR